MAGSFKIENYFSNLPRGCCPNKVYATIFNRAGAALKLDTGFYNFVNFNAAALDTYKINLSEVEAVRPQYYSAEISETQASSIPSNLPDEPYWIEYWLKEGAGGRALDTLLATEKVWWNGLSVAYAPLSVSDKGELTYYKAHVTIGYDTALSKLRFVAWIEKNGQRITNPQSVRVKWLTRAGLTISDFTLISSMSQMPGVFQAEQAVGDITQDEATPVEVSILTAEGDLIVSSAAVTSWD